jgi:hypothetical protein
LVDPMHAGMLDADEARPAITIGSGPHRDHQSVG